jgi:transcriptional regulator with XRE-family HTH domain
MTTATRRVRQPGPAPEHGTPECYRRGCRRPECTTAATAEARKWKYIRDTGGSSFVPAERVIRHVWRLRYAGMTDTQIKEQARLSPPHLYQIIRTKAPVRYSTAARIFAIPVPDSAAVPSRNGTHVPALGTVRRLQTLTAEGWPAKEIEKRIGTGAGYVSYLLREEGGDTVRLFTAAAIRDLYQQVEGQTPEDCGVPPKVANIARKRAAAKHWPRAAYWDQDDFDNPDFAPATQGTPRYIELAENGLELEGQGYTRQQAADRLGVTKDALQQSISRYRTAQADRLEAAA